VLSYMHGMIHPYYCLSLAPAVAGLFVIGVHEIWGRRESWFGRIGMAAVLVVTGAWSFWLLRRNADWLPALRWVIVASAVVATTVLVIALARKQDRVARVVGVAALLVALAGSTAYTIATLPVEHTGGGPSVGPEEKADDRGGQAVWGFGQDADNPHLEAMLSATHTDWSAAILRSSAAANLELKTDTAVMAIGGFSGRDPVPSLSQFQQYIADHRVTYYVATANRRPGNGPQMGQSHADITDWVTANFAPIKVGNDTVYDLTSPIKR
jgi:4-amino-4-deoxy-L-arabinose transferase-like glycosyltransferase